MNDKIKDVLVRAAKTFCETAAAMITVGIPFYDIDWKYIASVSATALVYTIFANIGGVKGEQDEV